SVDRGEIPRLVGLPRRAGKRHKSRRDAREHLVVLVHRRDRLVVLALPRAAAWPVADPRGRNRRRADRLRGVSQGNRAAAALACREDLYRHSATERDAERRPLCRARAARAARARDPRVLPPATQRALARRSGSRARPARALRAYSSRTGRTGRPARAAACLRAAGTV